MDERFCLKRVLKQIICKPFPLAVLKVIVFRSVSDCSEATVLSPCSGDGPIHAHVPIHAHP